LGRTHADRLRAWPPDDALTRQRRLRVEHRRMTAADRTRLTNRLTALLKRYFPQALDGRGDWRQRAACEFLPAGPTLEAGPRVQRVAWKDFYDGHRRLAAPERVDRFRQIDQAQPPTRDPAPVEASALMALGLAEQRSAVMTVITRLESELENSLPSTPT